MIPHQNEKTPAGGPGSIEVRAGKASNDEVATPPVDLEQAAQHLDFLAPPGTRFHFRGFADRAEGKAKLKPFKVYGTLEEHADLLINANAAGYGIFVVINEGGQSDVEITSVRALHADLDTPEAAANLDLAALRREGAEPHLVVESSFGKHHAYWKTEDVTPEEFTALQEGVIARFKSDKSVKNLSRVMRLAGFVHQKDADHTHDGQAFRSQITHRSFHPPLTANQAKAMFRREAIRLGDALAAIRPAPRDIPSSFAFSSTQRHDVDAGAIVATDRHADLVQVAARLARQIAFEGLARESALAMLRAERDRGRWTRNMPDDEMVRALDSALEKCRSGQWSRLQPAANDDLPVAFSPLWEALARELTPFTDDEFAEAATPHPHIFSDGDAGIFPLGEVTVVAAPGREGKTYAMVHIAGLAVLGRNLAGLPSERCRALIYSAEDDRKQYARKVAADRTHLSREDALRLQAGLIVPNLDAAGVRDARQIVVISEKRRPVPAAMVDALIAAVRPMCEDDDPVKLVIFETGSTLSEADEDNPGLKTLVAALKRIARELNVAVVLVHHTSQAAAQNLPALNVSVADIRGGTALAYNARQCFLLVNLGSEDKPFHEKDNRTRVRRHIAPLSDLRMSALICLDASKAADPPPIFLSWRKTDFGPAMFEEPMSPDLLGKSWQFVRASIVAKAIARSDDAKVVKSSADVSSCIEVVKQLDAQGRAPTVRAVSFALGHGADWAKTRLETASNGGHVVRKRERVPNCADECDVYRPVPQGEDVGSDAPADGLRFSPDHQGSNSSDDAD